MSWIKTQLDALTVSVGLKASSSDVTTSLALKANASDVTSSLALKANASALPAKFAFASVTGSNGAIKSSFGVSSVTRNSAGQYTVVLSSAFNINMSAVTALSGTYNVCAATVSDTTTIGVGIKTAAGVAIDSDFSIQIMSN